MLAQYPSTVAHGGGEVVSNVVIQRICKLDVILVIIPTSTVFSIQHKVRSEVLRNTELESPRSLFKLYKVIKLIQTNKGKLYKCYNTPP